MVKVPVTQNAGAQLNPLSGARYAQAPREISAPASGVPGMISRVMANFAAVQEKRDQVKVNDQLLQARAKMLELQREAFNTKGAGVLEKDGQTFTQQFGSRWDDAMSGIEANLSDSQRKLFKQRVGPLKLDFDDAVARHEIRETSGYETDTAKAALRLELDAASQNYKDSNAIDTGIQNSLEAFKTLARNNGWAEGDANWMAAEKDAVADFHAAVLGGALDSRDTAFAKDYLGRYGDALDEKTRKTAMGIIQKQETVGVVDQVSNDIWTKLGPKSDTEPVQLDKMMEEVRKVKDPDTRKQLESEIKDRAQTHDYSVRQREAAIESDIYQAIEKGIGLKQLRSRPDFMQLDGKKQSALIDHLQAEQKERMGGEGATPAGAGVLYWNLLDNPEKLKNMSVEEVWALTDRLGKRYRDDVLRVRHGLNKQASGKKVSETTTNTIIKDLGIKGGYLKENGKPVDPAEWAEITHKIRSRVDSDGAQSAQDVESITRSTMAKATITKPGLIWGTNKEQKRISAMTDQELDQATVQIAPNDLEAVYAAFLRRGIVNPSKRQILEAHAALKAEE